MLPGEQTLAEGVWTRLREAYDVGPVIGSGSFSIVCKVVHRASGVVYAGKFTDLVEAEKELQVLRLLSPRNSGGILAYHDVYKDESGRYVCLVSDLMRGPNLQMALEDRGSYAEEDAREIIRQILEALQDMHTMGVVHRDLKLENILLPCEECHTRIKVADFGLSAYWDVAKPKMKKRCGTPVFVAPEVLPKNCEYDNKVDVWSAGVVLYLMLGGYPPFVGEDVPELLSKIMTEDLGFRDPAWELVSPSAKELVRGMLTKDPSARLSAEEALRHSWISDNNGRIAINDHAAI